LFVALFRKVPWRVLSDESIFDSKEWLFCKTRNPIELTPLLLLQHAFFNFQSLAVFCSFPWSTFTSLSQVMTLVEKTWSFNKLYFLFCQS